MKYLLRYSDSDSENGRDSIILNIKASNEVLNWKSWIWKCSNGLPFLEICATFARS